MIVVTRSCSASSFSASSSSYSSSLAFGRYRCRFCSVAWAPLRSFNAKCTRQARVPTNTHKHTNISPFSAVCVCARASATRTGSFRCNGMGAVNRDRTIHNNSSNNSERFYFDGLMNDICN